MVDCDSDDDLLALIAIGDAVAAEMPGRTGQQCAQRWRHKVNPNIRKDKWTEAEDRQVRPLPPLLTNQQIDTRPPDTNSIHAAAPISQPHVT